MATLNSFSDIYAPGLSTLSDLLCIVAQPPSSFPCCPRPPSHHPSNLTSVYLVLPPTYFRHQHSSGNKVLVHSFHMPRPSQYSLIRSTRSCHLSIRALLSTSYINNNINNRLISFRDLRVDDFLYSDYCGPFFLLIEFHYTFSISYQILPYYVYYCCILIRYFLSCPLYFFPYSRTPLFLPYLNSSSVCLISFLLSINLRITVLHATGCSQCVKV